jgi:ribonuclease G
MKAALCCVLRVIRLIECWLDDGPGERRAALVENGEIVEVHIQRDLYLALGETGTGRIDRKTPSGAYLVTGNNEEVLVRRNATQPEGARVGFEIIREAICEPGRAKPCEGRLVDLAAETHSDRANRWDARLDEAGMISRHKADISAAFDIALSGAHQHGDVTVSFQRTKAGLVFDVDGIGDPLSVNLTAAAEIARLLRLYQVGGMVMIDFVAVESKDARHKIAEAFDMAAKIDRRPFERSAVNGFGLMQVVRARPRPSVLDQLFGTRIAAPSDETQALWLLRDAARSSGFGARTITAKVGVVNLLTSTDWAGFLNMVERQTGASLAVVADDSISGYGHVHVAQS